MRSLFPRIFLSFWLAMTAIGAGFAVIYLTASEPPAFARFRRIGEDALLLHGRAAAEEVAQGRTEDAGKRLAALEETRGFKAVLVSPHRAPIGARRPPSGAVALARQAIATGEPVQREERSRRLVAVPVGNGSAIVAEQPRLTRLQRALGPSALAPRVLLVFLVSGLVSYILASTLTRPLRHLRAAAQRLAAGDLGTRVGPKVAARGDEVAALARDFDRMAERIAALLESQQRLLRDVSHELRSPLARLNVALALARQRAGEAATAPLDRIEREAERLNDLVGEILTMARLENDAVAGDDEVDVAALVDEIVRDAEFEAAERGRHVRLVATDPAIVRGQAEILRRAVENVVRNAAQFTAEGSAVDVRVRREESATAAIVRIEVRDHGPGVPEDALRDIFLPFYRVSSSRDRRTGGSGIGLAIVDRGIRLHGGRVEARNAEGGGLVVALELPLADHPKMLLHE